MSQLRKLEINRKHSTPGSLAVRYMRLYRPELPGHIELLLELYLLDDPDVNQEGADHLYTLGLIDEDGELCELGPEDGPDLSDDAVYERAIREANAARFKRRRARRPGR
jgi:hypothetical protein